MRFAPQTIPAFGAEKALRERFPRDGPAPRVQGTTFAEYLVRMEPCALGLVPYA